MQLLNCNLQSSDSDLVRVASFLQHNGCMEESVLVAGKQVSQRKRSTMARGAVRPLQIPTDQRLHVSPYFLLFVRQWIV
jgi:hypothetical protein